MATETVQVVEQRSVWFDFGIASLPAVAAIVVVFVGSKLNKETMLKQVSEQSELERDLERDRWNRDRRAEIYEELLQDIEARTDGVRKSVPMVTFAGDAADVFDAVAPPVDGQLSDKEAREVSVRIRMYGTHEMLALYLGWVTDYNTFVRSAALFVAGRKRAIESGVPGAIPGGVTATPEMRGAFEDVTARKDKLLAMAEEFPHLAAAELGTRESTQLTVD